MYRAAIVVGTILLGMVISTGPAVAATSRGHWGAAVDLKTVAGGVGIPGQYIVVMKENGSAPVGGHLRRMNANRTIAKPSDVTTFPMLGAYAAKISPTALQAVRRDPAVAAVYEDFQVTASATQGHAPWNLDRIDQRSYPLSATYTYNQTGAGVHIYVLDTGIDAMHSEFAGRVGNGYDVLGRDDIPEDVHGHGTHVAGIAAGSTYGVAKGATLHGVKVLGNNGSGSASQVLAGLNWVRQNRQVPAVVNLSLSGKNSPAAVAFVQQFMKASNPSDSADPGITVVAAAGNASQDACNTWPASTAEVMAVGASSNDGKDSLTAFSNYGRCVDLVAPGQAVTSARAGSGSGNIVMNGTSMAAPHVAGAAALLLQKAPTTSPLQVAAYLRNQATDIAPTNLRATPGKMLNTGFAAGLAPTPAAIKLRRTEHSGALTATAPPSRNNTARVVFAARLSNWAWM